MNKKNKTPPISDAELFRQTVGDVQPIKKNNTVYQRVNQNSSPLSILQTPVNNTTKQAKNNLSSHDQQSPINQQIKQTPIAPLSRSKSKNPITFSYLLMTIQDVRGGYTDRLAGSLQQLQFNRRGSHCSLFKRLRKGQLMIEEEIDLHSCTTIEAKQIVLQCLVSAYAEGMQCIRIIHGKGFNSREAYSPMKYAVNHWLKQVPIVRAFCSCLPKDGGTGAVYVLIDDEVRNYDVTN